MTSALEGIVLDGFDLNASASTSPYTAAVLADSPTQYLKLDESAGTTAADASGNGRTGTYGSGVSLNQSGLLNGSSASVSFDGTANAKITTTYNPFTGAKTFEGWAVNTSLAANHTLFGGDGANQPQLVILTSGNFNWDPNRGAGGLTGAWAAPAGTGIGTVFHWALVIPSSTNSELFINGVSVGTQTGLKAYGATPGNIMWGSLPGGEPWLGKLDENAVYGSALTPTRILAHYTASTAVSSAFRLQGYDVTPPPKRQEWAQGADIDGASLVRDPLFDNREITLRLRVAQQTTMDLALAQIATLSKKLEEAEQQPDGLALVWTPAGSANSITFYVLSGTVEGLPIDLTGEDAGWFLRAPVVTVKLVCKPKWYGTPVTSSTTSSATPFVTVTIPSVGGEVPAEGRLLITDAATQSRRYIEWGLEWRYYDAATSLLVDSDDMVVTGLSGAQTTRTGAYDPNAAGNQVIRSTLYDVLTSVCGTGNLGHVGTYRVKARVYASATGQYLRFVWSEGDGPFRANPYVSPVIAAGFSEVDLGVITIPPKQLGTQRWQGRIEAYTTGTSGTDTLDVDYLVLVPAGEGYGRVRAQSVDAPGSLSGRDDFASLAGAGALAARTALLGGNWATAGAATDFAGASGGGAVSRATTSDAARRFAILGSATPTDVDVRVAISVTNIAISGLATGALARYVDTSNFCEAVQFGGATSGTRGLKINVVVAGVVVATAQVANVYTTQGTIRLVVYASGTAVAYLLSTAGDQLGTISLQHSSLATAGALASGKSGFSDINTAGTACTRTFDDFQISIPPAEPIALYSGKVAEIRHDGAIRQDSTGTYYGPVPAYRGSRFLVPAAGDENRTSRILVKAHRNDIEAAGSDNVTDNLTIQTIVTPCGIVVPF